MNNINNITFDFEQITNKKKEVGTCVLFFDDKLSCDYKDSVQKRILINRKTLVVHQKRYDKIYFISPLQLRDRPLVDGHEQSGV